MTALGQWPNGTHSQGTVINSLGRIDPAVAASLRLLKAGDLNEQGEIAATGQRNGLNRALLLTPPN